MVKIRLTRTGRKNIASYRVVVLDSHSKRDTKAIEELGYYLPHEKKCEVNKERAHYWLSVGAQPSDTVRNLLVKLGVLKPSDKTTKKYQSKPGKKAVARARAREAKTAETPAEASGESATETAPEAETDNTNTEK
jgi:small subunit ribosomal protein S16